MSYTFGAATTDDINFTISQLGADNTLCLIMGWWKPTTLTATRGLWSAGAVFGAEIDTVTSELRLRTDNTTDGQWATTGVNFTLNEWKFLAFLNCCENTGVLAQWNVWAGTIENAPTEVSISVSTAPVGNFTGNGTVCIGAKGSTGSLAFQGEIGGFCLIRQGGSAIVYGLLPQSTAGSFTTAEVEHIYYSHVLPYWQGGIPSIRGRNFGNINSGNISHVIGMNMDSALPILPMLFNNDVDPIVTCTINGATLSQERTPRPPSPSSWTQPYLGNLFRRR